VTNGWLLWNQANVDFYLRNVEPMSESPARLLEAALRELAQADLAQMLTQLSLASAEVDASLRARGGT
jgi:spore germination protein GerM